jgi:hypothetical protein
MLVSVHAEEVADVAMNTVASCGVTLLFSVSSFGWQQRH